MASIFEVLAEPNRRQILDLLRTRAHSVNEMVEVLEISQPAVSKHLRILKEAGLVAVHPDAQRRLYTLQVEPLRELDSWLAGYRRLWEENLDRLEEYLHKVQTEEMNSEHKQQ
jgi:DNA-binding transcriptional ArsR family regulator